MLDDGLFDGDVGNDGLGDGSGVGFRCGDWLEGACGDASFGEGIADEHFGEVLALTFGSWLPVNATPVTLCVAKSVLFGLRAIASA